MQRVIIVGSAGSGKSTVARRLGALLDLPVIHLDSLYWRPSWVEPSQEDWREQVRAVVEPERWVIDGNYSSTLDLRLDRADTAIFLDVSRRLCIYRVLKRSLVDHGKVRPDSAVGCPERLNRAFIKWVWDYPGQRRPAMVERLRISPPGVRAITLHSAADIDAFLAGLATD